MTYAVTFALAFAPIWIELCRLGTLSLIRRFR